MVKGNFMHEELLSIIRMARVDFIVNAVINEDRELCAAFCGDVDEAHLAGVEAARRYDVVEADAEADIVITTSAGYPLDKTFYQAVKGLCGVEGLVRRGGTVILAAECSEGMGNPAFLDCLRVRAQFASHDDYIRHIEQPDHFIPDQWQVEKLSQALRRAHAVLVAGGLSEKDHQLTLCERAASVESALRACLQKHGPSAKIAVVPEGPYVIPVVKGE